MPRFSWAPVAGAICCVLLVSPVRAAPDAGSDDVYNPEIAYWEQTLVVSATRIATPAAQIGSSVTLITAADIAAAQLRTVTDVLKLVPGLNVVQSGPRLPLVLVLLEQPHATISTPIPTPLDPACMDKSSVRTRVDTWPPRRKWVTRTAAAAAARARRSSR